MTGRILLRRTSSFLGTCAAFRHPNIALGAAHCVRDMGSEKIQIHFPGRRELRDVLEVVVHPSADLAILRTASQATDRTGGFFPPGAFLDCTGDVDLGEEFMAYGYPDGAQDLKKAKAVARFFRGYYQRFFDYVAPGRYRYAAAELSIPAPAGLSGGPVFSPDDQGRLIALVTTDVQSGTITDSVETEISPGTVRRIEVWKAIYYGVALLLEPLRQWLDENVPQWEGISVVPRPQPDAVVEDPLEVVHESSVADPESRSVRFEIVFNRTPRFFVIDHAERQEDAFAYSVWLDEPPAHNRLLQLHLGATVLCVPSDIGPEARRPRT